MVTKGRIVKILMIAVVVALFIHAASAKQYEQLKAIFDKETNHFYSNMFSLDGLKDNYNKMTRSFGKLYNYAYDDQSCKGG